MWTYTDTVKDHFFNPRNVGDLPEANAVGDVGSISCGDALRLKLRIDPATETIEDARFQTFGCGSAIAASSALTELIKGLTIEEALRVSNRDIVEYLGGLPPEKMHCSVMGAEALRAAIANYKGESWIDDHEEGELICKCFGVDSAMIERAVTANGLTTLRQVINYTKAGAACQTCHEKIEDLLAHLLAKAPAAAPAVIPVEAIAPAPEPAPAPAKPMTTVQRIAAIEAALAEMRPYLRQDGGDVELVEVEGKTVYIRLSGSCTTCSMATVTIEGIQTRLAARLGELIRVLPHTMIAAE